MHPSMYKFTIAHAKMANIFASYSFGVSVIHKTKGIWLTPLSAAFFRIIAYPTKYYIVEVITELPYSPIFANRPKINIDVLLRTNSRAVAFTACQEYFVSLLKYQKNNIYKQMRGRNGWIGKFIYSTPAVLIPMAANFGSDLSWGITQVSKHHFNVYLLGFNEKTASYEWIEFISHHRDKTSALDAANEAYQEALAAYKYDQVLSNLPYMP